MNTLDDFIRTHRCALCWGPLKIVHIGEYTAIVCANGCVAGHVAEEYVLEQAEKQRVELGGKNDRNTN